ncbi:hypothetical protein ACJZ2D_004113 [Fusarium nematophilum]
MHLRPISSILLCVPYKHLAPPPSPSNKNLASPTKETPEMPNPGDRKQPIVTWSDSESDDPGRGRVVTPEYVRCSRGWRKTADRKKWCADKVGSKKAEFKVGQTVYIRASGGRPREGPYKIETVVMKPRKFTLCDISTGLQAKDGSMFEAAELER